MPISTTEWREVTGDRPSLPPSSVSRDELIRLRNIAHELRITTGDPSIYDTALRRERELDAALESLSSLSVQPSTQRTATIQDRIDFLAERMRRASNYEEHHAAELLYRRARAELDRIRSEEVVAMSRMEIRYDTAFSPQPIWESTPAEPQPTVSTTALKDKELKPGHVWQRSAAKSGEWSIWKEIPMASLQTSKQYTDVRTRLTRLWTDYRSRTRAKGLIAANLGDHARSHWRFSQARGGSRDRLYTHARMQECARFGTALQPYMGAYNRAKTAGNADRLAEAVLALVGYINENATALFAGVFDFNSRESRDNVWNTLPDKFKETMYAHAYVYCGDCGRYVPIISAVHARHTARSICSLCSRRYSLSRVMNSLILNDTAKTYYATMSDFTLGNRDIIDSEYARRNVSSFTWLPRRQVWVHVFSGIMDEGYDPRQLDITPTDGRDGLMGYHHTNRTFIPVNKVVNYPFTNAPPLGLELEVYAPKRAATVAALRKFAQTDQCIGRLALEHDSSLDSIHGFEIISDPMGYTEWKEFTPRLLSILHEYKCLAYKAEGDYGIHLTMARSYLSPLQEARMIMFMVNAVNQPFIRAIAQRHAIYHGNMGLELANTAAASLKISRLGSIAHNRGEIPRDDSLRHKIVGVGKYAPINFKPYLAETRIFRATTHPESFMKNIEWMYALVEWVRAPSGHTWKYLDFVEWLGKRPHTFKDYPNLVNYLRRPSFGIRGTAERITNTWAHHLPKTKEELALADDALREAA